ncbi:hypothetical protein DB346_08980 [Verrucomicrobia bacterium LW23]|nr:hypothetical protein DB346_08980 [Verrucomicrobia bacterium LW23]
MTTPRRLSPGTLRLATAVLALALAAVVPVPALAGPAPAVTPTSPASLQIKAGDIALTIDPPEIQEFAARDKEGKLVEAPQKPADKPIRLTPGYDTTRTHILGNLYLTFQPETLTVTSESGTPYVRGIDFEFKDDTGVITNKDGRMKGKVDAKAKGALQRLDLVQADATGKLSVKKGKSVVVCPELPAPDPGNTAVAGIYVAPWRAAKNPFFAENPAGIAGATEYAVTQHEILPITAATPVPVADPDRLSPVLAKLRNGGTVKIALMGDSIMLGAESTRWWDDKYDEKSLTWKGRLIHALRQRFPKATIEVVEAYRGGVTVAYGLEKLPTVLAAKPDLVIMSFGVNDADPQVGKRTPEEFGAAVAEIMTKAREINAALLYVTPFPLIPWVNNQQGPRMEASFIPVMKQVSAANGAALVDVNAEYKQMNAHGIPWWSQNHNWHNHPGDFGHKIYAEAVLRAFPQ